MQMRSTMKETTDVLDLLQSQHAEVDELLARIEESDPANRPELFDELADKLVAHATVEEKIFYPAAMAKQTDELLHESVEDHLAIKRILAEMLELDPADDGDREEFEAQLAGLKEQVMRHAHDVEEGRLFPMLRALMDDDERAGLGNEVLAMFEELLPQHPCENIIGETNAPAPLPAP